MRTRTTAMEACESKIKLFSYIGNILLIFIGISIAIECTNADESTKIIGGIPANPGEFPWMVSIMLRHTNGSLQHLCGGTLIDMTFVITAAHCVLLYYSNDLMIMAGSTRLNENEATQQLRQVDEVMVHRDFDYPTVRNDIARLRVSVAFLENTPFVTNVVFPRVNHETTGSCWIAGWGTMSKDSFSHSNILNKAVLPIVPKNECHSVYPNDFDYNTQICAGLEEGGVDACVGDTGGALICNDLGQHYFAGIASWGYLCAMPRHPGVYTEIAKFRSWIELV